MKRKSKLIIPEDLAKLHRDLMIFTDKIQSKSALKYDNDSHVEIKVYYVLNRIYSFGRSLHEAIFSLCDAGWVHVTPILMRPILECSVNFLAIINSKEPEYMAFKFLYHSHIRFFRDNNFPLNYRNKAKKKIEKGIQDLSSPELRDKAKEYAYKHQLKRFFFQPEIKDLNKILTSYGGAELKLKYVYGLLSQAPHAQYHGMLLYKDNLDTIDYKPSYNKKNIKEAILFCGRLFLNLLKLRNDFEGLGLELEYKKLVKKFAFNNKNEF